MNRGGAEITGRGQDEVEGTTIEQLFGLEGGFLAAASEQLAARRRFRFERHYVAPNGARSWP